MNRKRNQNENETIQCSRENVANMIEVFVNICHFWSKFLKFWIENAYTSGLDAMGGTQKVQKKVQNPVFEHLKLPKLNSLT
jgi:hypothetical protein